MPVQIRENPEIETEQKPKTLIEFLKRQKRNGKTKMENCGPRRSHSVASGTN